MKIVKSEYYGKVLYRLSDFDNYVINTWEARPDSPRYLSETTRTTVVKLVKYKGNRYIIGETSDPSIWVGTKILENELPIMDGFRFYNYMMEG